MIIFIMSIITFFLFGYDKHRAVYGFQPRIPEIMLLGLSFLGGAFGGVCGMIFFRHKTLHKSFLICVPLFLILILTIDILLRLYVF